MTLDYAKRRTFMAKVILENVFKIYPGNVTAVHDANLIIEDKEFIVLVGPSGCGKSTTLRMIAGLEEISKGTISIDGEAINDVPPKDRDIAMVFQNYALYPHMSVYENMAFGLRLRRYPRSEIDKRVQEAADILDIKHLLDRKPKALSGGQRQRVAVGRAIVRKPKAFLFDEPLSNLDAKMRVQMRMEINKLHTRLSSTMIYVTHDQVEAMTMGDRIVVMKDGYIQQVATPLELYHQPANQFVAGFIGSPPMNFIKGRLEAKRNELWFCDPGFEVKLDDKVAHKVSNKAGCEAVLGIRPEDISDVINQVCPDPDHRVAATVELTEPMGAEIYVYCSAGKHTFICRISHGLAPEINQTISLHIDTAKIHLFDPQTGATWTRS
jgi:multiple sugar transport system ATP-binding protein